MIGGPEEESFSNHKIQ